MKKALILAVMFVWLFCPKTEAEEYAGEDIQIENVILKIPDEWSFLEESKEDSVAYYYYASGAEKFTIITQFFDENVDLSSMVGAFADVYQKEPNYSNVDSSEAELDGHNAALDFFYCDFEGEKTAFMIASVDTGTCVMDFVHFRKATDDAPALDSITTMLDNIEILEDSEGRGDEKKVYDFKSFKWGDTKETVIASEGSPSGEGYVRNTDYEYISYDTTAVGLKALLSYYFADQGLYETRYILQEEHTTEQLFIDDYNKFKKALTDKYGEPFHDLEDWTDDSEKEYYAGREGDALCYGYLSYETYYETDTTYIFMTMSADNYDVKTIISYQSKELYPEFDYSGDI